MMEYLKENHFSPHIAFLCHTSPTTNSDSFPERLKQLVLVMNKERVLSEVGTEVSFTGWLQIR